MSSFNSNFSSGFLVDSTFGQQIPGWESISPLDPTKMVAEAVARTLEESAKAQNATLNRILTGLPALLGIEPKTGQFPTLLVSLNPSSKLMQPKSFPADYCLKLQRDQQFFHLRPLSSTPIYPVTLLSETIADGITTLRFHTRSPLASLTLYSTNKNSILMLDPQIHALLQNSDGSIECSRVDRAPLMKEAGEFELSFQRVNGKDTLQLNTIPFSLCEWKESLHLSYLKGIPWEEISLSEPCLKVPNKLYLEYPNGKVCSLTRQVEAPLSLHLEDPRQWEQSFIYNPVHHSLLLPGADKLMGEFGGAVEVKLKEYEGLVSNWSTDSLQPNFGEFARYIESIGSLSARTPALPRENASAYLKRFYSLVRDIHRIPSTERLFHVKELEQTLLRSHPTLQAAEAIHDHHSRTLTLYLMPISREKTHQIKQEVTKKVPLTTTVICRPFSSVEIELHLAVKIATSESRLPAIEESKIVTVIQNELSSLLSPPPDGVWDYGSPIEEKNVLDKIRATLQVYLAEGELLSLEMMMNHPQLGYLTQLHRVPGEYYVPKVKLQMNVEVEKKAVWYA